MSDNDEMYVLTEWGCLGSVLADYGIDIARISCKVGEHIIEDFMELLERCGYVEKSKNDCNDCDYEKECEYKPKWGEGVAKYCPIHLEEYHEKICSSICRFWSRYAPDKTLYDFIHEFEYYCVSSVSRGALLNITDLDYIQLLRKYCKEHLGGEKG